MGEKDVPDESPDGVSHGMCDNCRKEHWNDEKIKREADEIRREKNKG